MTYTRRFSGGPLSAMNPVELGDWLVEAAWLLSVIEDIDASVQAHAAAMVRAQEGLKPLAFSPNTNVQALVVDALKRLNSEPGLLQAGAKSAVRRPLEAMPRDVLASLLSLLVNAGGEGLEEVSAVALQRFRYELDADEIGRALQVSIVELAGVSGGAMSVFAVVDQIAAEARLDWTAAFAALRQIASLQPKNLKLGLDRILRHLGKELPSPRRFRSLLREFIARSSPVVVLNALVELNPLAAPSLFAGAFKAIDEDPPLFRLIDHIDLDDAAFGETVWSTAGGGQYVTDDMDASEVSVPGRVIFKFNGLRIAFDELAPSRAQFNWRWALRRATGIMPEPEETPEPTMEPDAFDDEPDPEEPVIPVFKDDFVDGGYRPVDVEDLLEDGWSEQPPAKPPSASEAFSYAMFGAPAAAKKVSEPA